MFSSTGVIFEGIGGKGGLILCARVADALRTRRLSVTPRMAVSAQRTLVVARLEDLLARW